jgi:hypothetical protein
MKTRSNPKRREIFEISSDEDEDEAPAGSQGKTKKAKLVQATSTTRSIGAVKVKP